MTGVSEPPPRESMEIIRALRQSRRIRPVRRIRLKVVSTFGALPVLSGALVFVLDSRLLPTSLQATNKMASVRTGLEGSQGPVALRGTLPAEDNQLHSELDNGSAPVPSTPEPVSSPALSQAPPPPLAPAALEKPKKVRGPDNQTAPAGQAISSGTMDSSLNEVDRLLARAEQLLVAGDLAAARLLFERVVAAGDLRGAEGLARSYDSEMLRRVPVYGAAGDPEMVTRWREIAQGRQPNPFRREGP